jgi:hypothetical protein
VAEVVSDGDAGAAILAAIRRLTGRKARRAAPSEAWWRRWEAAIAPLDPAVVRALCERIWTAESGPTPAARAALWGVTAVATEATCTTLAAAVHHYTEIGAGAGARLAIRALGRIGTRAALAHLRALNHDHLAPKSRRTLAKTRSQRARDCGLADARAAEWADEDTGGLDFTGRRTWLLDDYRATIHLTAGGQVMQSFQRERGGWRVPRLPQPVRQAEQETLTEMRVAMQEVRHSYASQRAHLEQALRVGCTWPWAAWEEAFGSDPILRNLAARLIWQVAEDDTMWVGRPDLQRGWVDAANAPHEIATTARLTLLHPLDLAPADHEAWRQHLAAGAIRQPFPQIARETHVITAAEEATATYSNRFHGQVLTSGVLEQAIIQSRLEGYVGWGESEVWRDDPAQGLRAVFDLVRDNLQQEDGETVTLDRVRFVRLAWEHGSWEAGTNPVPLREIPLRVFSETMAELHRLIRRGGQGVNTTLEMRTRRVQELLPTLGLGARARLESYSVQVQGQRHHYRVHLASGGVYLLPDARYICIVPGAAHEAPALPFVEGDGKLAEILSKILLLAEDAQITDPVILAQLPDTPGGP